MLLARLLPGLREIRTPIVVGFIWLVMIGGPLLFVNPQWLVGLGSLTIKEAKRLQGASVDWAVAGKAFNGLLKVFSNPLMAAALSLLAYLMGAVSTMASNALLAGIDYAIGAIARQSSEHLSFATVVRLLGREPDLYDLYERLRSEIEFRAGVSLPLAAAALYLSAFWAAGTPLAVVLGWISLLMALLTIEAISNRRRLRIVLLEAISRLDRKDDGVEGTGQAPQPEHDQDKELPESELIPAEADRWGDTQRSHANEAAPPRAPGRQARMSD